MAPGARWLVVAALAVGLASTPVLVRAVPVRDSDIGAPALAQRIQRSWGRGWSGEVATRGGLDVPVQDSTFSEFGRLLGQSGRLRVWWRGPTSWRVDRMRGTGETDLVRQGVVSKIWTYESRRLTITPYSDIRLPDDADVLPPTLARRMLQGARDDELSRIPARRVAGRDAAGLRLSVDDPRSTVGRVDVWADEQTGLPLRVELYAVGARLPVLTTETTSLDLRAPSAVEADLRGTPGVPASYAHGLDAVAGANAFAPFSPPDSLVGLPRRGGSADLGAVGVYGRGPTAILAIPLRDFVARELRQQLRRSKRSRDSGGNTALEMGPLSVLLAHAGGAHYLLIGTVEPQTLELAARRLRTDVVRTDR